MNIQRSADLFEYEQTGPFKDNKPLPTMWFVQGGTNAVKDAYANAESILEYGSGGSTVFAASETAADVLSIESDATWAANLRRGLAMEGYMRRGVEVRHVDIGPTRAWGKPRGSNAWRKFCDYPLSPWSDPDYSPDVVLIDGRFRLACFAATMMNAKRKTIVLWDDYTKRPSYQAAEDFVKPVDVIGRMARFDVEPMQLDAADMTRIVPWFFETL